MFEKYIEELKNTRVLSSKFKNGCLAVKLDDFEIELFRRVTSSSEAKRKQYNYRGNITFRYMNGKTYTTSFVGKDRSLLNLINHNEHLILSRLKQHFKETKPTKIIVGSV